MNRAFISVNEKEVKRLEAVAAEIRAELNHMKGTDQKVKAKLEKLHREISETRKANRLLAATNNARNQLILHLWDGN